MKGKAARVGRVFLELLEKRSLFSAIALTDQTALQAEIAHAWKFSLSRIQATLSALPASGEFPSYTNSKGKWVDVAASDWTSGFFAGELWQAYKKSGSAALEKAAIKLTSELSSETSAQDDLGFRFMPSDGLEYGFTDNHAAKKALIAAATAKISAFESDVGMFRSVDGRASTGGNPLANFPVLIDHSMDVELIYRAASLTNNSKWIKLANEHMQKLETSLVRPNGSTCQWGYFNDKTGNFIDGETRQGYGNSSTWSRGQAWAMYSFTQAYAMRGRSDFLASAEKTADYFIAHLPADGIPYWDFNAPITGSTPRDTSAAAVAASALLSLAKLIPGTADATRYENTAQQILASLASPAYLAEGTKSSGILLHGALWVAKGDSDQSLSFGDYYFLQAMNQYEGLF